MKKTSALLAMLTSIVLVISAISVITTAAESAIIQLKAEIIPAVSITVDRTLLDFGKLAPGDSSKEEKVVVTNDGAKGISIDAEVTGDLFVKGITIDKQTWEKWSIEIDSGKFDNIFVGLDVPSDFAGSGPQDGLLTLWAEAV